MNPSTIKPEKIKVGILYSTTGLMADTERPALRATLLAIDEINNKGGINGSLIQPVVYNPNSNWKQTAVLATKLIEEDKVVVIFGCFSTASRKEVKPIVEKYDNLLIQTVAHAIEESKNIIYLGMAPNQQLIPAISWIIFQQKERRVYLIGADYIWPHVANEIISHEVRANDGEIIGLRYIPLGSTDVKAIVDDIIAKKPDYIFSTVIGISNNAFLNELYNRIPIPQMPAILSFGITPSKANVVKSRFVNLYTVWSYSKLLDNPENKAFLAAYKAKYGSNVEVDDPAATSYAGVYLWAQGVKESPSPQPLQVREAMLRQSMASPSGAIYIDPNYGNAWKSVLIERINASGMPEIVWTSSVPIEPIIYPEFKTKPEWNLFEYKLYVGWGNAWEKSR